MSFGAAYLSEPALFPARPSGEPWGEGELVVHLPGGPYALQGLSAAQRDGLGELFEGFAGDDAATPAGPLLASPAPTPLRVLRAPEHDFREVDTRGWTYAFDLDPRPEGLLLAGRLFMARLDWRPDLRATIWTPLDARPGFLGIVENVFRVLLAHRVVELGGALLHSAGIDLGGGAAVLHGPSGAGKSTISRMALEGGQAVLSDDLNVILPGPATPGPAVAEGSPEGFVVRRLPFTGELRDLPGTGEATVPLAHLARLRKGPRCGYRPEPPAVAVASMLASAPYVNVDPHRLDRLSTNLETIASRVPTGTLTFGLDDRFDVVAEALGAR